MTRILLMVNLALPFITGYQFVMPSTLIIPPPDSSNSSFDQCNLIGGVYQCSYHSLFDCDPTINHFYYWNTNDFNNLQTTTVEFQIPVRMINIIIFVPLSTTRTILRIKISSVQDNNLVQARDNIEDIVVVASNHAIRQNYTRSLSSDVVGMNIDIGTNSEVVMRIVFCASQG